MPTKNRIKVYAPDSYYHVYNRGVNRSRIFVDDSDFSVFLNMFKRYLSDEPSGDRYNRTYDNISNEVELLAYCLMPNHFHLLVYQKDAAGMTHLLQRALTSYSVYFNKKYKRFGQLFQDVYKASQVSTDSYLQHISRYIHLNPTEWREWRFSSLDYYAGKKEAAWINTEPILGLFKNPREYMNFLSDYEDYKKSLEEIKHELANR